MVWQLASNRRFPYRVYRGDPSTQFPPPMRAYPETKINNNLNFKIKIKYGIKPISKVVFLKSHFLMKKQKLLYTHSGYLTAAHFKCEKTNILIKLP